jgi:primase-polymerase (primpol)-like protein
LYELTGDRGNPVIVFRIPQELTARPQWVLWRYERGTKVPYQINGRKASPTNPRHWASFEDVYFAWLHQTVRSDGIGYVFSADDPFLGIDLDDAWPGEMAEEPEPWAAEILKQFENTYHEESPSGDGFKIWCIAQLPDRKGREWKIGRGAVELYSAGRYFTMTGRSGPAPLVITDHQDTVDQLIAHLDSIGAYSPKKAHAVAAGEKIAYGTQHNQLVSWAGTMRWCGMSARAIEAALLVENEDRCEIPGPAENIRRIAQDAGGWER